MFPTLTGGFTDLLAPAVLNFNEFSATLGSAFSSVKNLPVLSYVFALPILENGREFFRWLHVVFGIVWIGMLYYFNFVQTEYFKVADAAAKADALKKLAPRALWWFRWGAAFTFLTGVVLLWMLGMRGIDFYIFFGALLGTIMATNVWFVIWPRQKIVIAGGPNAPAALARAGCASRTNVLFSIPLVMFMGASAHLGGVGAQSYDSNINVLVAGTVLIGLLELNALLGKPQNVLITSVGQVIFMGFVLTLVLAGLIEYL